MLAGLKTYIIAALAVLAAILGFLNGEISLLQAIQAAGLALGLGGNRAIASAVEILTKPRSVASDADPEARQWVTYIGVAVTILSAALAFLSGDQDLTLTVGAILGALGLNFLGLGQKKAVVAA